MLLSTLVVALTMSISPAPKAAPIGDLQNAYKELKAAEEKKDVDGIKKSSRCRSLLTPSRRAPPMPMPKSRSLIWRSQRKWITMPTMLCPRQP